jgi:chemotaxis protein MotB
MSKKSAPIIVRRSKRVAHAHHGGAWKVAYADFVTAMMAFFLLLWLLNAVSKEQLEGISDYFAPISTRTSTSGGGGLLAGKTVAKKGVFETDMSHGTSAVRERPSSGEMSEEDIDELLRAREEEQFHDAERQLRQAIAESPELQGLAKSLLVDNTPEGLRIQIIDQEGLPMFPRGEAEMYPHTREALELVAKVVQRMPQDIDISGHTDATRFQNDNGYSNWELSADRANAARRTLLQFGIPETRISRVAGRAATEPLLAKDPDAPGNRRLSVVLLRGTGAQH